MDSATHYSKATGFRSSRFRRGQSGYTERTTKKSHAARAYSQCYIWCRNPEEVPLSSPSKYSKLIGIIRDLLSKVNGKLSYSSRRRLPEKSKKLTDAIVAFLERGDNSCVMPGKDDFVNCNGEKVQKHYLNDYIHNLHAKFRAENPNIRVGKTAFAQRRPKYIIPTSFSSRHTCLCQHHQNMSLKLRAFKALGVQVSKSPDVFIGNYKEENAVQELVDKLLAHVNFSHWKRVDVDGKKNTNLKSSLERK